MTDRLRFGTAGLRAALGDGPLRMNTRVVEQAAMAIATHKNINVLNQENVEITAKPLV